MKQDLINKIKSRGYWRVNFQPVVDQIKLKSLGDCRNTVEKNQVLLRGWNYPHFPSRDGEDTGLDLENNFYRGWIDWENHIEFWQMYQSGQFIHYLSLREDWSDADGGYQQTGQKIEPLSSLNIVGSLVYQLTEIFEFLSRLTKAGVYDEGVNVSISLNNTRDRKLWISDFNRGPFLRIYKTAAEKIEFTKGYSKNDLCSESSELAMETILYVADRFGWHKPSIETLKKDQQNLLNGL